MSLFLKSAPVDKAQAVSSGEPMRQQQYGDGRRSVLHDGIKIKGDWQSDGVVEFGGEIAGNLSADVLVIAQSGRVSGTIRARSVLVEGKVNGTIFTDKLHLKSGSDVQAEMNIKSICVDAGALIQGDVRLIR